MSQGDQLLQTLVIAVIAGPLLVCVISGIGMLGDLWRRPGPGRLLGWLAVVVSLVSLACSIGMALNPPAPRNPPAPPLSLLGVSVLSDALSIYFILLVNAIAFVSSWSAVGFLSDREVDSRWRSPAFFHLLAQLFHLTMILVPLMNNLIALWVAMQATTLVSTLLVGFQGTRDAQEAAWKYLMITSTGIIFALLGTMFLANAADQVAPRELNRVMDWTFLVEHAGDLYQHRNLVKLSFLFILVGYGVKAGFAPMHTWLPDGHGEAPAPVSAMLSGVLLKSALYAILRFYTITNQVLRSPVFTSTVLLGSAMLSLLIATPFILKGNRFKRVLAYHSLEHMGIITFGIGIGGPIALFGALLHVLNHAVTKALMFLSFGNIWRRYETAAGDQQVPIAQPTGVLSSMPLTGAILMLGGLALVGTPPFNIFMSELIILWGAFARLTLTSSSATQTASTAQPFNQPMTVASVAGGDTLLWWFSAAATIVFLISTTLIFYGLVRHLAGLVLHDAPARRLPERFTDVFPLILLMAIVVISGVWVAPQLAHLIALSVKVIWPGAA